LSRRFQSTATHYLAGRPPYAPALIAQVARRCGLRRTHRILDLGCGPAQLAIAFGRFVGSVVAIDPEPEMLKVARTASEEVAAHIEFIEASSTDLGPYLGSFRMVAIGRAFHWMDRADTLERLDTIIDTRGAVVLFHDNHLEVPENGWHREYRALLARYSDGDAGWERRRAPDWISHEAVLLSSPFHILERIGVIERRETAVDRLVDRAFSMSSTSPEKLGRKADDLAREIRLLMINHGEGGIVTEIVESHALIARRASVVRQRGD
jgi:SAM-dependent methyltransferase